MDAFLEQLIGKQTAKDLGITKGAQYNRRLTKAHIAKLWQMKREGYKHRDIADALGCSIPYVGMIIAGHRRMNDTIELIGEMI